jgi:hypothetical protein
MEVNQMSTNSLMRLSGLAAIIGGVLLVIGSIINAVAFATVGTDQPFSVMVSTSIWQIMMFLMLLGMLLILLGLVGIYRHQAEAAGTFGLVGFTFAFVGTALAMALMWVFAFVAPTLAEGAPVLLDAEEPPGAMGTAMFLSFLLFTIGWLLFGVASLKARVFPVLASVFLILGAVLGFLVDLLPFEIPIPLDQLILGIGIAWLGWVVWTASNRIPLSRDAGTL